MPFSVYLKQQKVLSDAPPHKASRILAKAVIACGLAFAVGQNAIQLSTDEPWRNVKLRIRGHGAKIPIPQLLAPLDFYIAWNYPLPYSLLRHYEAE